MSTTHNGNSFKVLQEAGLPDGVVNFVPAPGRLTGDTITGSPDLAAINFTGSTNTFNKLWKQGSKYCESEQRVVFPS